MAAGEGRSYFRRMETLTDAPAHDTADRRGTEPPVRGSRRLGTVALIVGSSSLVLAPLAVGIAAFNFGLGLGRQDSVQPLDAELGWSFLASVSAWQQAGVIAFVIGALLAVWAATQGVIAVVRDRGRATGMIAIVAAVLSPVVFWSALGLCLAAGFAASSSMP